MAGPIPSKMCSSCGFVHPPPWDATCPIKIAKEAKKIEAGQDVTKFIMETARDLSEISDHVILKEVISEIKEVVAKSIRKAKYSAGGKK